MYILLIAAKRDLADGRLSSAIYKKRLQTIKRFNAIKDSNLKTNLTCHLCLRDANWKYKTCYFFTELDANYKYLYRTKKLKIEILLCIEDFVYITRSNVFYYKSRRRKICLIILSWHIKTFFNVYRASELI